MKKVDIACIIDDDPIYVFVTQKALEFQDVVKSILVFENGKDAYDGLKELITNGEKLPDFILLDINMPIWDGWDFLDEFIKIPVNRKITIYMVSSSDNPDDRKRAEEYQAVSSFMIKPISVEELKEKLMHME